uniref:Uncharacterized protein n=1 Tax=Oryctolagus cuniculus TaxID=9986 RepID=A0A5F9C151_RABIT
MKLFYLLALVVLVISQVMPGSECNNIHYCDSQTSVCLRRNTNCVLRRPGICPGRSFCCMRMT